MYNDKVDQFISKNIRAILKDNKPWGFFIGQQGNGLTPLLWEQDYAGSSPVYPTYSRVAQQAQQDLCNVPFASSILVSGSYMGSWVNGQPAICKIALYQIVTGTALNNGKITKMVYVTV